MHQSCRGCSGEQHCMKFMPKIAQLSPPSTKHGGKGDFGAGPKLAAVPRPLRPHPCTLSSPSPSLWSHAHQCWITHNVKKIGSDSLFHQVKDLLDVKTDFNLIAVNIFQKNLSHDVLTLFCFVLRHVRNICTSSCNQIIGSHNIVSGLIISSSCLQCESMSLLSSDPAHVESGQEQWTD